MFATNAQAASTFLDPTFGTAGWATADFGGNDQISQLAIQPDGKILVAGTVDAASFTADVKILRYEPDGTPDPSFGNNGQITISYPGSYSQIDSLVAEADGSFLTSTRGFDPAQNFYAEVSRYSADGELDTSFGDAGHLQGIFGQLAIQGRKILLLGRSTDGTQGLLRFNADGSVDRSFGTGGVNPLSYQDAGFGQIATTRGGRILLGGADYSAVAAAELSRNGRPVKSFADGGAATVDPGGSQTLIYQVGPGPHGSVLVAGGSSQYIPTQYGEADLVRFTRNGTPDPGFGSAGLVRTTFTRYASILGFASDREGRVVATIQPIAAVHHDFVLARYLQDGSLDPSFGTDGLVDAKLGSSGGGAWPLALLPDGRIIAGGWLHNGADDDFAVARFAVST